MRISILHAVIASLLTIFIGISNIANADTSRTTAKPYAEIDWTDHLNPVFVTLGNDLFALSTEKGIKIWHATKNTFSSSNWPMDYKLTREWAKLGTGTLISGYQDSNKKIASQKLIWWNTQTQNFVVDLDLPKNHFLYDIVPINAKSALVCMAFQHDIKNYGMRDMRKKAAVVNLDTTGLANKPKLKWVNDQSEAIQNALLTANIRGNVESMLLKDKSETVTPPVTFNTNTCKWEMQNRPPELQGASDLTIKQHRLPNGNILVTQADWYSSSQGYRKKLAAPYLWKADKKQWVAIENTAGDGQDPSDFSSYGVSDGVTSFNDTYIEFLDPLTLHWTRSQQTFPTDISPPYKQLAPLSDGRTLAFSSMGGYVFMMSPMQQQEMPSGQLVSNHSFFGGTSLNRGGWFLINDGDTWHPSNRPEIINFYPTPMAKSIKPLPKAIGYLSSVELKDNTLLTFGGLPPACAPDFVQNACLSEAQPSYRYFPKQDRWEEVPELVLYFSNGQFWDGGNSSVTGQWPRNDAIVRNNGDFVYLDGFTEKQRKDDDVAPLNTVLKRWRPDTKLTELAPLRKGRVQATLLELSNNRLAVIGGEAQKDLVALEKNCDECSDKFVSVGTLEWARTTEIFDEKSNTWQIGPLANYAGGRAFKLANGRIFKMSLDQLWYVDEEYGYSAEIADAAFTKWERLPKFPVKNLSAQDVVVVKNRVIILPQEQRGREWKTVVWDDEARKWLVWNNWPEKLPLTITPLDDKRVMARYYGSYEILELPI